MADALPTLVELRAIAETLPAAELPALLGELARIEAEARARLHAAPAAPPAPAKALLTFDQVAELLEVTSYYVSQLVKEGKLATVRLPGQRGKKGRQARILASDLEAMLQRNRIPAAGESRGRRSA